MATFACSENEKLETITVYLTVEQVVKLVKWWRE